MPRSPELQRINAAERYERYRQYREACREAGVQTRTTKWCEHHRQLADDRCRLSRDELHAFWKERFTDREIRAMGGSLDFLYSEGVAT